MQQLDRRGFDELLAGHVPLVSLAASATVVTAAIAAASYYGLERPVLRFKR